MKYITLLILLGLIGCQQKEPITDFPIMGNLPLGNYAVGYQTLFEYDASKNGVAFSDWDGKLNKNYDPELGRQYQINVWYPAESGTGESITFAHYVDLIGRQINFNETEEQKTLARETFVTKTRSLAKVSEAQAEPTEGEFTKEQLDQLMALDTYARLNAEEVNGKFPVIIYPNGVSPAFNSISCEFLASHGYVVVAFAPKGRYSSVLEISTIGLEVAVDDFEFVLGKVEELSIADVSQVSIMANAILSSVGAAVVSRNEKIKALVSLEGGLPSAFEQRLLNESVFYQAENIQAPILITYSPHPAIDPEHTFHLTYSDRYYAFFPHMSEFVMLNYGMFDAFIPNILGKHSGNTQKGFEAANELVLRFLNQKVKGESGDLFEESFLTSRDEIDSTFVLSAVQAPPNITELKNRFWEDGFESIENLYQEMKSSGNSQPFSMDFYTSYRDWLAWQKDENYEFRLRLYQLAVDSYPESARINYYVAYYSMKRELNEQAIKHYRRTLSLVDTDPELSPDQKSRIKEYSVDELNELL